MRAVGQPVGNNPSFKNPDLVPGNAFGDYSNTCRLVFTNEFAVLDNDKQSIS